MGEGAVLPKDTHLEALYLSMSSHVFLSHIYLKEKGRQCAFVVFLQKTKGILCNFRLLQSKDHRQYGVGISLCWTRLAGLFALGHWLMFNSLTDALW